MLRATGHARMVKKRKLRAARGSGITATTRSLPSHSIGSIEDAARDGPCAHGKT